MKKFRLKAPFPWFGGKSRVAHLVWERFGDCPNYVEPFFGSGAVMLGRPGLPGIETVNDLDCFGPATKILRYDLTWDRADKIKAGDMLLGFDEHNGEARKGLRAPKRYRRLRITTVVGVKRIRVPAYRLQFDDGTTVVASANHQWLGGSHKSGGRGWRWVTTKNMVCNRKNQRSWVLKVADVQGIENSYEAGRIGGLLDGEGSIAAGPGLRVTLSQNRGPVLDRAREILEDRGYKTGTVTSKECHQLQINGGIASTLGLLMRFRPQRLINKLISRYQEISLYGRHHRAVGLVSKEFLGRREVIAIQTDSHTLIAEGLASHNCFIANFWRAVQNDPSGVALWADWPVNEADMHARHLWLVNQDAFRAKMKKDPQYFDVKIAGWWVWGISQWIGGGWCSRPEWSGRINVARAEKGIHQQDVCWRGRPAMKQKGIQGNANAANWDQRPNLTEGNGVHRTLQRRPRISGYADAGVHAAPERDPRLAGQQMWHKRPVLKRGCANGVHSLKQQVPDLGGDSGAAGRGLHASAGPAIQDWMYALADRLRRVRVCCGDWKRILGRSPTECIGLTGVFLDPPYSAARDTVYASDDKLVAHKVREWAIEHGDNPMLRIALCGYEGEHKMPENWTVLAWKTNGGHGNASKDGRGRANAALERIWFSPHCLGAHTPEFSFV
jgi:hypothetical protein